MGPNKRGPASKAELALASNVVRLGERPKPPSTLNERAALEWERVVDRMPSNWFSDETLSILEMYCEHVAEGAAVQAMIETVRGTAMANDESYKRYRDLQRDKELQTRAALSCATKMRLTQQSSYTDKASGTAKGNAGSGGKKPWEK